MLRNKPQSVPFDILSLFKTKPFLQYSSISQEEILILPAPRMELFVNCVSDGNQIHSLFFWSVHTKEGRGKQS